MGRKVRDAFRLREMGIQPDRTGSRSPVYAFPAAKWLLGVVLLTLLPACEDFRPVSPRGKASPPAAGKGPVYARSQTSSYPNVADYVEAPEPGGSSAPGAGLLPAVARPVAARHTVVRGDTLSSICRRYGLSVKALKAENGLSSDLIVPGAVLTIPGPN